MTILPFHSFLNYLLLHSISYFHVFSSSYSEKREKTLKTHEILGNDIFFVNYYQKDASFGFWHPKWGRKNSITLFFLILLFLLCSFLFWNSSLFSFKMPSISFQNDVFTEEDWVKNWSTWSNDSRSKASKETGWLWSSWYCGGLSF